MLKHHWSLSESDWSKVISNTSTLSFPYRLDREELGEIGGVKPKSTPKFTGFDIHSSIFVNAATGGL